MISIPCELSELLRQAYHGDADSTLLLRRLAAAVEDYFDAEDEGPGVAVQSEESSEDESAEQYEEGRRHGLEAALSLIQVAESEIHEDTQEIETDVERGATIALGCIAREIELAMLGDSSDSETAHLGLKAKLKKASGKRSTREPVVKALKPWPKAQKPTQTPAAKLPGPVAPTDGGGKHQRAIVEFLRSRPDGTATRADARKHLIESAATTATGAYRPIETAIASRLVEDLGNDRIGLPQA